MPSIAEIRQQYPQYDDMTDGALANALHTKFYADIPRAEFDKKIGLVSDAPGRGMGEKLADIWQNPPSGPSLVGLAKTAVEGMTAFGDAASGKLNPSLPEHQDYAADKMMGLAGTVMLGSAPGLLGAPAGALTSGVARRAVPGAPAESQAMLQSAERIGVPIPQFLATDNMTTQRVAAGLKNIPGAGDKIVKSTQETVEGLGGAAQRLADDLGTGNAEVAGSSAKDAITNWITKDSKDIARRVYGEVDGLVKPDVVRPLLATTKAVAEIMAERANARIPGKSPAVDLVSEAITDTAGLNYQGVKGLRTFLGDMTPEEMIAKGIPKTEAKRLYGALSDDLKATVREAGGPAALAKFETANTIYSQITDRKKALAKIVGAKGDAAPEAVFSRLMAMAGSKSSADVSKLAQARKAMGPEAWNEVTAAAIAKLGRDPQGNFSPDRFFTAYGNLSGGAKTALFRASAKDDLARSLDDINAVVNAIRERVTKFGNPSGTAQNLIGAGMVGSAFADPTYVIKALAGVVGGNALAAALSRPATAKAIAAYVKATKPPRPVSPAMIEIVSRNLAAALGGGRELSMKLQAIASGNSEDQKIPAPGVGIK